MLSGAVVHCFWVARPTVVRVGLGASTRSARVDAGSSLFPRTRDEGFSLELALIGGCGWARSHARAVSRVDGHQGLEGARGYAPRNGGDRARYCQARHAS